MTVGTDRSASDIIDGLFKRVEQVERHRVFLRDENGNIEFESPINVGGGTIIGGDAAVTPTNLVLTPGVTLNTIFVDISWDPSANVSYYDVLVVENASGIVHTQVNVGGESTRATGLEPNTLYDVNVRAVDNIGRSSAPLAGQFTSVGDTTAPPQVTGLSVTAGLQSLVATWNESIAEDVKNGHGIYEVQIDTANTFNTVDLRSVRTSGTITSWTDLDPDTTYYVRVKAIDSSGNEGVWSATGSGVTGSAEGRDFTLNPIQTTEIADDAITAPKIAANQIEAGHLVTGTAVITGTAQIADAIINSAKIISLDAALVTFGTMSGDRIAANSLDVNTLKASTLSATTITLASDGRFIANGASGSLYIDGTGIQLFDAVNGGGTRTIFFDTATGNAIFTGTVTGSVITGSSVVSSEVSTGTSGRRVTLDGTGTWDAGKIVFYTGHADEGLPGAIRGYENIDRGIITIDTASMVANPADEDDYTYAASLSLSGSDRLGSAISTVQLSTHDAGGSALFHLDRTGASLSGIGTFEVFGSVDIKGSVGDLTVGGVIKSLPAFRRYRSSNQSIPNATTTTVVYGSFDYNDDAATFTYDAGTNRFRVEKAGRYRMVAGVVWGANGTGFRNATIVKNGATILTWNSQAGFTGNDNGMLVDTGYLTLAAGDELEVQVRQNSGGAVALAGGIHQYASIHKVR